MAKSYPKSKGRRSSGTFAQVPHAIYRCNNYVQLSMMARALLDEFILQYNGSNNGDLSAVWGDLSARGWKSKTTVNKYLDELIHYGFIVRVQQGGINIGGKQRPNLYAVTWHSIDKITYSDGFGGKCAFKVGEQLGTWKEKRNPFYPPKAKRKNPKQLVEEKKMKYMSCTESGTYRVLDFVKSGAK